MFPPGLQLLLQRMHLTLEQVHDPIMHRTQRRGCDHGMLGLIEKIRVPDFQQFPHSLFILDESLLTGEGPFDRDELFSGMVVSVEVFGVAERFDEGVLLQGGWVAWGGGEGLLGAHGVVVW